MQCDYAQPGPALSHSAFVSYAALQITLPYLLAG